MVALALAGPATAAPLTASLERARATGEHLWTMPTNCRTLDAQIVPDASLPAGADAIATFATQPTDCILYVARRLARPENFIAACGAFAHEGGHLRGFDHVDDPTSIMFPSSTPPRACFRAGTRELNRRRTRQLGT